MAKFLRVLVVLILILSIAALTLGIMLFAKREILKGRTHKLEEGLITLARTLEAEPPKAPEPPATYPARDVSGVAAEIIENPTTSPFWNSYKQELESQEQPTVNIGTDAKRRELMSYYKINPVTSKPDLHPVTSLKISDGPGTTQGVIDDVIERANAQLNLLTETRQQLLTIRTELVETIRELNQQKQTLRERLVHIVQLNNEIAQLNRTIEGLRRELQQANDQIAELKLNITDLEGQKQALQEENEGLKQKTAELLNIVADLRDQLKNRPDVGSGTGVNIGSSVTTDRLRGKIPAGIKGRVVSVDQKNLFVVMAVEPAFVTDLFGALTDGSLPMVELLIQRKNPDGGKDNFIAKVRISQVDRDKNLAIGDILPDWQQGPINEGDVVLWQ